MLCDIETRNAWGFWNCSPMEMHAICTRCALKVRTTQRAPMPVICFLNSWSINQLENSVKIHGDSAEKWCQPREEKRAWISDCVCESARERKKERKKETMNEIQNERCYGRRQSNPCAKKAQTNIDEDMTNIHRIVNGFWRGNSWLVNFDWILVFRTECLINFSRNKLCSTKSVSFLRLTSSSEAW